MKFRDAESLAHNIADSLASGMGFMIGVWQIDVFREATSSPESVITVDILRGNILSGVASETLREAVTRYADVWRERSVSADGNHSQFEEVTARFWSDDIGRRFSTTIVDKRGRRSTIDYVGVPGRRLETLDLLGRRRPKPARAD